MQQIYLKDRSFSVEALPSEISLLVELMDLCNNAEATFEMFSRAIKREPGLTAKFLKIANSPAYRQWNEITEIKRMLIVIGLKNVKKIITTCTIQQFFSKLSKKIDNDILQLWLRALVCAHLAEKLAHKTNYRNPEEAYLAGLLHQIGIVLLLVNYGENYQATLEQYDACEDYPALEQKNYALDHCEVGAALIESWELDSLLSDAIRFQHASEKELLNSPELLRITSVARTLASPLGADVREQDIEKAKTLLQLPETTIQDCLTDALDESCKVLSELGLAKEVCFLEAIGQASADAKRTEKSEQLTERIKNVTLASCFLNGVGQNTESFVKEIRINFALLFNLTQLVFINQNPGAESLTPFNDLQLNKLDEISFSTQDQDSLIVKCFRQRSFLDSTSHQCAITDNQIIRLMRSESAYFFPIYSEQKNLGVLAIGVNGKEQETLKAKLPLLKLLIREIGDKYLKIDQAQQPKDSISLTDFNKIVHEVKNPLTIINNYLYLLGKKLEDGHPASEEIDFIKEEMLRVGAILAKGRDQGQQDGSLLKTDINKLLSELNGFFCQSLYGEKSINSSLQLDPDIPALRYPENKLKQVFINIIKNAVEALVPAGKIEITTRDNCFQNGTQFVEISIKDNGSGIPVVVLKNLFKPVESTKKGHSGLGLSIVGDIISELSGTISCYSSPTTGTEFKILLPRLTIEQ